jgi:predicted TIM-barrel fold metal-dependent hydrolase
MVLMNDIFGGDERFELGYCVPNEVDLESIDLKIKENVRRYGIKILKIHPNITEINLDSILGVERVETILESSQKNKLKVIVHGGRSPILKNEGAVSFATMKNLEKIDWSITSEAVTIAHAGAFGCDTLEIKGEVLPKLKKMLAKYDNLYVDLSGIEFGDLCLILKSLDTDRIVFGSDSFYEYQWKGLVRLFAALQTSSSRVEESFLKICSLNYSHLFARDALC